MLSDSGNWRNLAHWRVKRTIVVLMFVISASHGVPTCSLAQTDAIKVDPRQFGINIPPGPLRLGTGERFLVRSNRPDPVVAKLYASIGDYSVLLLPDGQLVHRRNNDIQVTDLPFVAMSQDDLAGRVVTRIEQRLGYKPDDQSPPRFKTKKSRNYVFIYDTSDTFAGAASRIMNSMYRGVLRHAQNQRIDVHGPQVPLVVIMFRSERDYQKYQRMPPGMIAYYDSLTNQVVMYEESDLASVRPDLAVQQAISTMAHEGAHQILHNIGVQRRLSNWPMWLAEGLAEYFAPTSTGSRLRWKGAGEINDFRMTELEEYLKIKSTDGLDGTTLRQTISARRLTSTGYATAWSLTHYLATRHRASFNRFVNAVSQCRPFEGSAEDNLETFQQYFESDLASLEKQVMAHLKKQPYTPPYAQFPHHVATISFTTSKGVRRMANEFLMKERAQQWLRETLDSLSRQHRQTATSRIHKLPSREQATRFKNNWLVRG